MTRRLLTLLAALLFASAYAEEGVGTDPPPEAIEVEAVSPLAGFTIACSVGFPSTVAGCFLESPPATLGPLGVAVGVDAQTALTGAATHLAPYLVLSYSVDGTFAWVEAALPAEALGIPVIGRPDYLRVGFSHTF